MLRHFLFSSFLFIFLTNACFSQKTVFRGYADVNASYEKDKLNFALGEEDLFIKSNITDHLSFLGESVFKFSGSSPTTFDVSIERIILKFNIPHSKHSILAGKVHTPTNYWNSTYHHGRLFFPTIGRPLFFAADIFPQHTTGIGIQGVNLSLGDSGRYKFGYDLLVGNGIGSTDVKDNDTRKSFTAVARLRIAKGFLQGCTFAGSYYNDIIAKGATLHDGTINNYKTRQSLWTGSLLHFGKKLEWLAEGTMAYNNSDTTGIKQTIAGYIYAGIRTGKKWVSYVRADHIKYEAGEVLYHNDNMTSFLAGIRYEISYLAVLKLEYQHTKTHLMGTTDGLAAQFAIGF